MAFDLKTIKRKSHKDNVKPLFAFIKNNELLTDNIRFALHKYITYRLSKRYKLSYKVTDLDNMITELFEKVCHKNIQNINKTDLIYNELEIIYQIKRAIFFGATKSFYYEKSSYINLDNIDEIEKPVSKRGNLQLDKEELIDYFKDVMI